MTTKNNGMFGKELVTKFVKVMSVMLVACMLVFSMTACGTVSQQDVHPTTEHSTEADQENPAHEPVDPIDDGYWHDDPTEEPTEEPSATEAPAQSGTYTYEVDGIQITLRTNIDDYIYTNSAGATYVNMLGIAESLGFEYTGTHPDELDKQVGFHLASDSSFFVYASDETDWNMGSIEMDARGNHYRVIFSRNDVNDSSIATYWIGNGGNLSLYSINYEQIVVFTLLLENGCYAPSEDWLASSGLPKSTSGQTYMVNE